MGRPRKNPLPETVETVPALDEVSGAAPVEKSVRSRDELEAELHAEEYLKRNRPNLAGFEQKLAYYGERKGWVRRWVVDQTNRVPGLLERGWRLVKSAEVGMSESIGRGNTDLGDCVSIVTTVGDGPCRQVLMEVPQKLFDMQVDASMDPVRRSEQAIREGAYAVNDKSHVYQPRDVMNRIETSSKL